MVCNYPISIFDHYYNDPDAIREYALSLEYTKITGFFPGYRTECLSTISKEFWELSYQKFLPDNINPDEYTILSQFQKVYRFSNDPEDPVNLGWIHKDTGADLAAVLYLDPDPISDNGTSFYVKSRPLPPSKSISMDNLPECLNNYDVDDEFRELVVNNNSQFNLTAEVKNSYNRLLCYDGKQFHGASNYYMKNEEDFRLTQVFFFFRNKCECCG